MNPQTIPAHQNYSGKFYHCENKPDWGSPTYQVEDRLAGQIPIPTALASLQTESTSR